SVTFRNGGTVLATVKLSGNTATYRTSTLPPGDNAITATYGGDSTFASSGSGGLVQQVAKLDSAITVIVSPNPANFGQAGLTEATVTASGAPPSGTVVFRDGTALLRQIPLISGVASFTISNLSMTTHSITGAYSGDLTHSAATSAPVQLTIGPAVSTVFWSSNLSPSVYGQDVTFSVTVRSIGDVPRGTVTFSDGNTPLGNRNLNNGVAGLTIDTLSPGMHQITAAYRGDGDHAPAVSAPLT